MNAFASPRARGRATALALAALTAVSVSACSSGSSGASSSSPSPSSPAPSSSVSASTSPAPVASPSASATPSAAASADLGQIVAITVAGGKVTGPKGRVKIKQGSIVTLQVTSDVADEVHLHGYDKHVDVEKGGTARLTFTATLTGVFEVELEQRALQLTQLQVQ